MTGVLSLVVQRIVLTSVVLFSGYAFLVLLLTFPAPQRYAVYLNWANYPFGVDWNAPESFGFAHNKVRNFNITTPDNVTIGKFPLHSRAWHILPTKYHFSSGLRHLPANATVPESKYDAALTQRGVDTVVYFHGNAGNRASPWRIGTYKIWINPMAQADPQNLPSTHQRIADKFNVNIITVDYRGFGNSEGFPTEEGLNIDAKAVWDWLIIRGGTYGNVLRYLRPNQIHILGHSLGSGVAAKLASSLCANGTAPKTLILEAAYSSITEVMFEYRMLGLTPLLGPLRWFPFLQDTLRGRLTERFDSVAAIENVTSPILLIFGTLDRDIPTAHSRRLFHRAVNRGVENFTVFDKAGVWPRGDKLVAAKVIPGEGSRFDFVPAKGKNTGRLTMLELDRGHHNNLPYFDITYDVLGEFTGLGPEVGTK
ncbi:Alpha/Beta hydrolase protein [Endogone sp. FLAS-F59071]|nr:Alpha/Beta hydrolase protein [Endogone sp. FLAS-F59071]|eukprot:RUS21924.1 Alpha/Beta hydrolase protein [Endogone sp. FLAS-F59071]